VDNSSVKPGTATRKPTPAEARRSAKNDRKRAGQEAARLAAVARRRRNAGLGVGLGVIAIVGVIVLITTLGGTPAKKTTASQPTASTSASAAPAPTSGPQAATEEPTPAAFTPNVPAGESSKFKTKPVVKAGTGTLADLTTKILIKGTGTAIKSGDSIRADYVGVSYADGTEFDSSWKDGQDFTTVIGAGKVIKGWDQALIGVKAGTRIQIDVPEALAYQGQAGYPPGALRFVVDVLVVTPAA